MKEMKASEKVAQKMTHNGAVAENLATGEVERISGREEESHFNPQEETVSFTETAVKEAAHAHTWHRERKAAQNGTDAVRKGGEAWQRPSSRLQFTDEERYDPALQKYTERSDQAADKLDAAKAKIPTKTVKVKERVFDEATGKGKTSIRFEEVEKKPNSKLRHNPLGRPVQDISLAAHNKVHEVEQENVSVEAGHKAEEMTEQGVLYTGSKVRQAYHHHKTKPWRDATRRSGPMPTTCTKRHSMTIPALRPPIPYPVICRKSVSRGTMPKRCATQRKMRRKQRQQQKRQRSGRRRRHRKRLPLSRRTVK